MTCKRLDELDALALEASGIPTDHFPYIEAVTGAYPAMAAVIRAALQEHGPDDHEPECPICVTLRKFENRK